jgi:hypothetical protein
MLSLQKGNISTSSEESDRLTKIFQKTCYRCGGLMVNTFCISPDEATADFEVPALKCLQCGDIVDPLILKNRFCTELPVPRPTKKIRYAPSQSIGSI